MRPSSRYRNSHCTFGRCCTMKTFQNKLNLGSLSWCITKRKKKQEAWIKLQNSIFKQEDNLPIYQWVTNCSKISGFKNLFHLFMSFQVRNLCMDPLSLVFWLHMATDGIIQTAGYSWWLFGAGSFIVLSSYFCHSFKLASLRCGILKSVRFHTWGGVGPRLEKCKPCSSWHQTWNHLASFLLHFIWKAGHGANLGSRKVSMDPASLWEE